MTRNADGAASSVYRLSVVTFDKQVSAGGGGAGHKLILAPVSEMDVADGERVCELSAADLTAVRRLDLHPVFQPFVGDAFVIDSDLEGDGVSLLGVQVLQHGRDQDGCTQVRRQLTIRKDFHE